MRRWLIKKLGGYPDIDAAIEAIREKELDEKYTILTLAVKKLFNTIDKDDILHQHKDTGKWMCEGKPITDGEVQLLTAEATSFVNSRLWKVLQTDIKYQANKVMFIKSRTEQDIIAGKLWLNTLDTLRTRLNSLSKGSAIFNNSKKETI